MRQHVNPLSQFFQLPLALPTKEVIFQNPDFPMHIDIGSARGEFLIELASNQSKWNFLGLEIRDPLVIAAEKKRKKLELSNLKFLFCNVNVSLDKWLIDLDDNQLRRVSIQFPDPWFKRKHLKRRVVGKNFIDSLAKSLSLDGELFIQSDILQLINSMTETIERSSYFDRKIIGGLKWLDKNPYDAFTERELYVKKKKLPIYRALYYRNNKLFLGF